MSKVLFMGQYIVYADKKRQKDGESVLLPENPNLLYYVSIHTDVSDEDNISWNFISVKLPKTSISI